MTLKEIEQAIEDYQSRFWDEDHPDYQGDEDYSSIWEKLYYEDHFVYVPDGESYTETVDSFEIPGLGTIKVVDRWDDHDDGHALHVVFTINDDPQTYQYTGWDDSWGGEGGWEGPLERVEGITVTKTKWTVLPND